MNLFELQKTLLSKLDHHHDQARKIAKAANILDEVIRSVQKIESDFALNGEPKEPPRFPGPIDGSSAVTNCDSFMKQAQAKAKDVELSADCALAAKEPATRAAFIQTFFSRAADFSKFLGKHGFRDGGCNEHGL